MTLPESWQFLGSMWWVLHVIVIVLIFFMGFIIGRTSASPEPDPVDQDALRKAEEKLPTNTKDD